MTEKTKSVLTCDIQAARYFPAEDLARERELMTKCWWDFRCLHPVRRTDLFASEYANTFRRFTGKYVDYTRTDMVSGLTGGEANIWNIDDPNPKRAKNKRANLTGLWRARQAADELGMKYSVYITSCFTLAAAAGWKRFPRPIHLYSERMKVAALDEQVKELERYIPDFRSPTLKLGSTAPYKAEFDEFLYELGALKRVNTDLAFNRMVQLGYIDQATADQWLERARAA